LFFQQWGKPGPLVAPPDPNRKRGITNKQVSNAKLRGTGCNLIYPSFRDGYASEIKRLAGAASNQSL